MQQPKMVITFQQSSKCFLLSAFQQHVNISSPEDGGGILRLSTSLICVWLGGGGRVGGVSMATAGWGVCTVRRMNVMAEVSVSRVSTYTMSRSETIFPLMTTISSPAWIPGQHNMSSSIVWISNFF